MIASNLKSNLLYQIISEKVLIDFIRVNIDPFLDLIIVESLTSKGIIQ